MRKVLLLLVVLALVMLAPDVAFAQNPQDYCWGGGGAKGFNADEAWEGLQILLALTMLFFAGYYPGQP